MELQEELSLGLVVLTFCLMILNRFGINPILYLYRSVSYKILPADTQSESTHHRGPKKTITKIVDSHLQVYHVPLDKQRFTTMPYYTIFLMMNSFFLTSLICIALTIIASLINLPYNFLPSSIFSFVGFLVSAIFFTCMGRRRRFALIYVLILILPALGLCQGRIPLGPADIGFFLQTKRSKQFIVVAAVIVLGTICGASIRELGFVDELYNSPERIVQTKQDYPAYQHIYGSPKSFLFLISNHSFIMIMLMVVTRFRFSWISDFLGDIIFVIVELAVAIITIYFSKDYLQFNALDPTRFFMTFLENRTDVNAKRCRSEVQLFENNMLSLITHYIAPSYIQIYGALLFLLSLVKDDLQSTVIHVCAMGLMMCNCACQSFASLFNARKKPNSE